jgi:uncharacterized membrane protein
MRHWNVLIAAHALGATFSVFAGLVVLRTPRKGNRFHRRLGMVWMVAMYWTVLSSFGIRELHPHHLSWIHGLSAWTFLTLTVAVWAARTGRRRVHRDFVVGSYLGLVGAGIAAMAFPVRLAPQLMIHRPLVFAGAALAVAMAVALLVLVLRRSDVRWRRRIAAGGAVADITAIAASAAPR